MHSFRAGLALMVFVWVTVRPGASAVTVSVIPGSGALVAMPVVCPAVIGWVCMILFTTAPAAWDVQPCLC